MNMKDNEILDPIKELARNVDIKTINQLLANTELKDFEMNKSTIMNISEWCLNGESENEIRQRLSLTKNQWAILVTVCPTLLLVMKESKALAEIVLAGSLFQTAVGGKRVRKQVPIREKIYEWDEKSGKSWVVGEKTSIVEIEEELPPNPMLLRYLAEKKMNEKMGEVKINNESAYKKMVESLTPEEKAMIEAMKKASEINNGSK